MTEIIAAKDTHFLRLLVKTTERTLDEIFVLTITSASQHQLHVALQKPLLQYAVFKVFNNTKSETIVSSVSG